MSTFNIKHIRSTPFHAMSNGIIERYHSSLKRCIKRFCVEKPTDWDVFIGPCLYAQRETVHNNTGFAPNELVFGQSLKGPMQILRQLFTDEQVSPEFKLTYQHVLELRSRIQETCELAKQELTKSQIKSKVHFDKKTKHRTFTVGSLVLLMRPSVSSAMEYLWTGPFVVTKVIGIYHYEIKLKETKRKVYHINMLKQYNVREAELMDSLTSACAIASVVDEENDMHELSVQDNEMFVHYKLKQKGSYLNVKYDPNLSESKLKEARHIVLKFKEIFSDVLFRI